MVSQFCPAWKLPLQLSFPVFPDRPSTLLQNVDSELYKLCATHGQEELGKLKRLAGLKTTGV